MSVQLPTTMKAVEISEPGPPDALVLVDRPVPELAAGEVLIRVAAAGINRPDCMQRLGNYPPPPGASDIPGLEVAGEIVAQSSDVSSTAIGDRVCVLVQGGGYAEYCAAPAQLCLPIPAGFSAVEAAAIPETFFTVWTNVFDRGRLGKGERILIHGGSSGIGTTAIQLATALGSQAYVTAGSQEKCAACIALGAAGAINYRDEDFVSRVADMTDGAGVNVILDMVGGEYFARNLKCLAPDGRLVQIAVQQGFRVDLNLLSVMMNRFTITGSTLRPRGVADKAPIADALREKVWPLFEAGAVKPPIHATFPLAAAAEGHALMESSAHVGKIMLTLG